MQAIACLCAVAGGLVTLSASAQGTATLTGTIVDATTGRPVPGVGVTVSSSTRAGEQLVMTDGSGSFRLSHLSQGPYTLRIVKEGYRSSRRDVVVRDDVTLRVNHQILPLSIELSGEEIVVVDVAPTVDVGSSAVGVRVDDDLTRHLPLSPPRGSSAASRSFEVLGAVAPSAQADTYGMAFNGATSPENQFSIDGLAVNDPALGTLGTPLSAELVERVDVLTSGYMPEQGRAMGGVIRAVTRSGTNDFHGSVWSSLTPGALEGRRKPVVHNGAVIATNTTLDSLHSFGAEAGGPIVRDRLWFYVGGQAEFSRYRIERSLYELVLDAETGAVRKDEDGVDVRRQIAPEQTTTYYVAAETALQLIGKLTYLVHPHHRLTLTGIGTLTRSGGDGTFAFDSTGSPEVRSARPMSGTYGALAHHAVTDAGDVSLAYSAELNDGTELLDVLLGWHHQRSAMLPSDGSEIGSRQGLAGTPQVIYMNAKGVAINELESVPSGFCNPVTLPSDPGDPSLGTKTVLSCPAAPYVIGGPGEISDASLDNYQLNATFTRIASLVGQHVLKVGFDPHLLSSRRTRGTSGGVIVRERPSELVFREVHPSAFLAGPAAPVFRDRLTVGTDSIVVGGFLQDSWQPVDGLTLNAGVRYDTQVLHAPNGDVALVFPNEISPRVGVVYDPTRQGRARLLASYARYFEEVPLTIVDRAFSGEVILYSGHDASMCRPPVHRNGQVCQGDQSRITSKGYDPNQTWGVLGNGIPAVDPELEPQSLDEIVVGAEYEPIENARIGASYIHRSLHRAVEDISRDEGNTFFIGNPGYGIASDFPEAVRDQDALTLFLQKRFSHRWLAGASYTLAYLRGNHTGLFRPETGQFNPNVNSDFDVASLLINRDGPLPADHTHELKLFGAADVPLPGRTDLLVGLAVWSRSGAPLNYLGAHPLYGNGEVFILPRGSAGRGDWVHSVDMRLGYSIPLRERSAVTLTLDVFNVFNFQAATQLDEIYTRERVLPIPPGPGGAGATKRDLPRLTKEDGAAFDPATDKNPHFLKPIAYQEPRQVRFGAKVTF